jgi:hypothetical protein
MTFLARQCCLRYQHAGVKRQPSLTTGSTASSTSSIKMFSLRSLRHMMARTTLALSRVAKDTPGLSALLNTQTDITDILDPRIPYDSDGSSSRRHLLSGDPEFSLAESDLRQPRSSASAVSVRRLQRELDELNRRRDRRTGGSFAIKCFLPSKQ